MFFFIRLRLLQKTEQVHLAGVEPAADPDQGKNEQLEQQEG